MKTLLIAIFALISTFLTAQNTVTWLGGTPGKETAWNEAKNWSNHRVPDAFSNVVIPDVSSTTFSSPVISQSEIEINSLIIEPRAELSIDENSTLLIHDEVAGLANVATQSSQAIVLVENWSCQTACSKK